MIKGFPLLSLASLLLGGCAKSDLSESESTQLRQQFSQDSYEDAMKAQGKDAELQAERQRWAEHEKAGG